MVADEQHIDFATQRNFFARPNCEVSRLRFLSPASALAACRQPQHSEGCRHCAQHEGSAFTNLSFGGSPLFNSGTNGKAPNEFVGTPAFRWSMLFVGLAVGFLGMDIMVRRPMMRELSQVRSELSSVERDMEELVLSLIHI